MFAIKRNEQEILFQTCVLWFIDQENRNPSDFTFRVSVCNAAKQTQYSANANGHAIQR